MSFLLTQITSFKLGCYDGGGLSGCQPQHHPSTEPYTKQQLQSLLYSASQYTAVRP